MPSLSHLVDGLQLLLSRKFQRFGRFLFRRCLGEILPIKSASYLTRFLPSRFRAALELMRWAPISGVIFWSPTRMSTSAIRRRSFFLHREREHPVR